MLKNMSDPPKPKSKNPPETLFLLAGFSWRTREFVMWRVAFDATQAKFVWGHVGGLTGMGSSNFVAVLGQPSMSQAKRITAREAGKTPDVEEANDVKLLAMTRLARLVKERGGLSGRTLDMEPFEVLRDIIRENASQDVGGPPQLVKVYASSSSRVFGVFWPNRNAGKITVLGRTLLPFERLQCPVIDPDTFDSGMELWPPSAAPETP